MEDDTDYIKEQLLDKFELSVENRRLAYYKLNSSFIIVSATIFSIVLSLSFAEWGNNHIHDMAVRVVLILAQLCNGFHILCAAYLLYTEIIYHNLYQSKIADTGRKVQGDKATSDNSAYDHTCGGKRQIAIRFPKHVYRLQNTSFVLFSSMVIFYLAYAVLKQFN